MWEKLFLCWDGLLGKQLKGRQVGLGSWFLRGFSMKVYMLQSVWLEQETLGIRR